MERTLTNIRKKEEGFTLVELAIVLIIIGLLITGILKGQEMIANAQVQSTISGMKGIDAAANTFRETYNAYPGDMSNATTRLTNCAAPCNNGDGNGRLSVNVGAAPAAGAGAGGEGVNFFTQMSAADLISGLTADGSGGTVVNFGDELPTSPAGGGFMAGNSQQGVTGFTAAEFRPGNYLVLNGTAAAVGNATGGLSATQAARIDRKLDDGVPDSGSVLSNSGGTCRTGSAYNEGVSAAVCALASRLGG